MTVSKCCLLDLVSFMIFLHLKGCPFTKGEILEKSIVQFLNFFLYPTPMTFQQWFLVSFLMQSNFFNQNPKRTQCSGRQVVKKGKNFVYVNIECLLNQIGLDWAESAMLPTTGGFYVPKSRISNKPLRNALLSCESPVERIFNFM